MDINPVGCDIVHVFENATPVLAEIHYCSDIFSGRINMGVGKWFFAGCDCCRVGVMGGVINFNH